MKVLFLCRGNVGRSQMAEAFFNSLSRSNTAISAGIYSGSGEGRRIGDFEKAGVVVDAMRDVGIDVRGYIRKQVTRQMADEAGRVVSMVERTDLPDYLASDGKVTYWKVEDGKGRDYEFHCKIRDEIRGLVEKLIAEIG